MVINLNLLLLVVVLSACSALSGAVLALLGVWVWYTVGLVNRIRSRGDLYLADFDHQRSRQLNAAMDMATGLTFMRQALHSVSPEMALEFTREEPKKGKKK
jgi:hypothetical protein